MTRAVDQILIIEGDPANRQVLRVLLQQEGYRIIEATTSERAEIEARSHRPDLLIGDLELPDGDGLTVIRRVRSWSIVPIIVLTAHDLEEQKIAAFDAGADDYITKPFSAPELLARVRAGLRRRAQGGDQKPAILAAGPVRIDLVHREVRGPQGELYLTPLQRRLLECLARRPDTVVPQRQILREAWGPNREHDLRSLRVYIKSLREKLESDPHTPRYVITVRGLGYKLRTDKVGQLLGASDECAAERRSDSRRGISPSGIAFEAF
jgi:two-component system KDP operon response regulator KdpE